MEGGLHDEASRESAAVFSLIDQLGSGILFGQPTRRGYHAGVAHVVPDDDDDRDDPGAAAQPIAPRPVQQSESQPPHPPADQQNSILTPEQETILACLSTEERTRAFGMIDEISQRTGVSDIDVLMNLTRMADAGHIKPLPKPRYRSATMPLVPLPMPDWLLDAIGEIQRERDRRRNIDARGG